MPVYSYKNNYQLGTIGPVIRIFLLPEGFSSSYHNYDNTTLTHWVEKKPRMWWEINYGVFIVFCSSTTWWTGFLPTTSNVTNRVSSATQHQKRQIQILRELHTFTTKSKFMFSRNTWVFEKYLCWFFHAALLISHHWGRISCVISINSNALSSYKDGRKFFPPTNMNHPTVSKQI